MTNDECRMPKKAKMTELRKIPDRLLYFLLRHSSLIRHSCFVTFSRISQHFLNGGVACEDATQAVLAQRDHPKLDRFLSYRNRGRALID
jgi:hypothetical protein